MCSIHLFRLFWRSSVWESASSLLQWIDQKLGMSLCFFFFFAIVMNIRWMLVWQPRIASNSGRYISVWEEGWIPLKGFMTVWLWCILSSEGLFFGCFHLCYSRNFLHFNEKKKLTWSTLIYGVEIHPCREALHASQIHLHRMVPSVTAAGTRAKNDA